MFMNIEDDVIPGEKIAQFKEVRKEMKTMFDANPERNAVEMDKCDNSINKIIADIRRKNIL